MKNLSSKKIYSGFKQIIFSPFNADTWAWLVAEGIRAASGTSVPPLGRGSAESAYKMAAWLSRALLASVQCFFKHNYQDSLQ